MRKEIKKILASALAPLLLMETGSTILLTVPASGCLIDEQHWETTRRLQYSGSNASWERKEGIKRHLSTSDHPPDG
jgi:hypothetical protein